MKLFQCTACNQPLFFENTFCTTCGSKLGYLDFKFEVISSSNSNDFSSEDVKYVYCANHQLDACNWLISKKNEGQLCKACSLNRVIPNLNDDENFEKWRKIESAKHRLVYSLQRFDLPLKNKLDDPENGLAFDFLSPTDRNPEKPAVRTGHANGVITINIEEADSVHREYMRKKMDEPYRTLIGHLRHEVGHYYWDQLIYRNIELLEQYRKLFGDEREDYGQALQRYYDQGAPDHWESNYISEYATMHSWEDWAETWAHYFHLIDTLETAYAFGLSLNPNLQKVSTMNMQAGFNPYYQDNFDRIIEASAPLAFAVNSINRSMGQPDLYPFVFNPSVVEKLRFVHKIMTTSG
ncbi:zinc-binding metallopeptidase family protein [Portibacter marinus]|uniref:zinc-binding metallopeptidase family protein n=1 Tax=Portibacter marinus TaxID=2898660 RepID=UPI001F3418B2|nr:putative zinc-binding metallopeptidase [Portibacter marinus]